MDMKFGFNSIKVRLERTVVKDSVRIISFNSIKVRLELKVKISSSSKPRFQFHKGTIRTFGLRSIYALERVSIP